MELRSEVGELQDGHLELAGVLGGSFGGDGLANDDDGDCYVGCRPFG